MLARLSPWFRSMSVSSRTALSLAIGFTLMIAATALLAFSQERSKAIDESLARLDQRNAAVVSELGDRFDRIQRTQARTVELFREEHAALTDAEARRQFEALYPLRSDGTRRSIDTMFTGGQTAIGMVHGMAGYIPAGIDRDDAAVRDIMAATHAIRRLSEGSRYDLESLYYFTPRNGIVIFAPNRPDRLEFYRHTAPADFAFQDREFATIATIAANPARVMRCTSLQSLISLKYQEVWTTGCMTPVDRDARHIGTFGTSMPLDEIAPAGRFAGSPEEEVILISREGRLIYHPGYTRQNSQQTAAYLDITASPRPDLAAIWALVRRHGQNDFTGKADALDAYVSLHRVPGPGWYALTVKPEHLILARALRPIPRIAAMAVIALAGCLLIVVLVLRHLVARPLRRLTREAERITRDLASDAMLEMPTDDRTGNEVARLVSRFETLASAIRTSHGELEQRVAERTSALNDANEKLRTLSELDPLTGVANRRKILSDLDLRLQRMGNGGALAVIVLDVDRFKMINDRHGHVAGDDALRALASRVQSLLRPGDMIGRMGGEEFMVILDRARPVVADAIAERVRAAIARQPFQVHGNVTLNITASLGVACWSAGDSAKALYARADAALYEAKASGRNCAISSHDPLHGRNAA
ncbi:diguanylate cyclase [Blastomonas sp. UPD001]|jgi:diguanylate cyclase (GGDEF)-like protein|uniref:sensor domain-containing diguanylate cyclase n=1 Tax=Blastomonas sp. UPD001 TaxID=2217673 RepID=UPI001300A3E6|nr:diguanylate cyclase [Blastomonas sp. UPD001]